MITAETVTSPEEFAKLEREWDALWQVCPHRSIGLAHWWVLAFWRHVCPDNPLRVILVRRGGRLVLIAPLMAAEDRIGPFRERWLQTLSSYKSGPADFLCAEPDAACFQALWDEAFRDPRWDCLAIWQLPASSPTERLLLASAESRGMSYRRFEDSNGWVISTGEGWERFERRLSRKLLENLRRRRRRLESEHGPISVARVGTPEELLDARQALVQLGQWTWAHAKGVGLFSFHHALMEEAAARGHLALELLSAGGRPLAYEVNFSADRRITSLAIGYDRRYARYGPGQLLRLDVIRRFFQEGRHDVYDFMAGGSEHKAEWASAIEGYLKLYVYRRTARARALCIARRAGSTLRREGVPGLYRAVAHRASDLLLRGLYRLRVPRLPRRTLRIAGHSLEAEVAVSEWERSRGLMYRRRLAPDAGMLFVCPGNDVWVWMANTSLPLDVAFIGQDGRILAIEALVPLSLVVVKAPPGTAFFLEVNRGWFAARAVHPGDGVELPAGLGPDSRQCRRGPSGAFTN